MTNRAHPGPANGNIHTSFIGAGEIRGFVATPEPGSWTLVALGLAGVAGIGARRRRRA